MSSGGTKMSRYAISIFASGEPYLEFCPDPNDAVRQYLALGFKWAEFHVELQEVELIHNESETTVYVTMVADDTTTITPR